MAEVETAFLQPSNLLCHIYDGILDVIVRLFVELHPYKSLPVFLFGLLLNIRIDAFQLDGGIGLYLVELLSGDGEEGIVEIDNDLMASVIDVEWLGLDIEASEFGLALYAVENLPISVSPTIDALLDVANQQTFPA